MRISANQEDRGYEAFERAIREGKVAEAFLDGVRQDLVETADEEEGIVVRLLLDEDGLIAGTETLHGRVTVEFV